MWIASNKHMAFIGCHILDIGEGYFEITTTSNCHVLYIQLAYDRHTYDIRLAYTTPMYVKNVI
jgi:cell division ATPase FtsA